MARWSYREVYVTRHSGKDTMRVSHKLDGRCTVWETATINMLLEFLNYLFDGSTTALEISSSGFQYSYVEKHYRAGLIGYGYATPKVLSDNWEDSQDQTSYRIFGRVNACVWS